MDVAAITAHYGGDGSILGRIDAALTAAGLDPSDIDAEVLAGVDEFHLGGRPATLATTTGLGLEPDDRVLDVGCGIGGVTRTIAREHGCTVHGIDLTPPFVEVATALSDRVGLRASTTFAVGDALSLPVADGDVDAAVSFHVGMNIADKHAWAGELARVVRPGGAVMIYDITATGDQDSVTYPQPWARTAATSSLAKVDEYVTALAAAGLVVESVTDRTELVLQAIAATRSSPPPVGLGALMGPDFPTLFGNLVRALDDGTVAPVDILARRPAEVDHAS